MPDPFVVAFVVGVTPGKWARVWAERMSRQLELRPLTQQAALAALADGSVRMALLRLPVEGAELSAIPLYWESPVVLVPKDHAATALDTVAFADLVDENVIGLDDENAADAATTGVEPDWAAGVALVAANVGVAVMPQSVARALSRRDVTALPLTDAPETRVALVWVTARGTPESEEFVGIVRGRTANSSRGADVGRKPRR